MPMTVLDQTRQLFFTETGLESRQLGGVVGDALRDADDGELFLEYRQSESFSFDDGRLRNASFDTSQGFGLRAVTGESTAYAHGSVLDKAAIARAAQTIAAVRAGHGGKVDTAPARTNQQLYGADNPLHETPFADKVALLEAVDTYVRGKDPRVRQVSVNLSGEWQAVYIRRADGEEIADIRPLIRLDVSVVAGNEKRQESGHSGTGGRALYRRWLDPAIWRAQADEALRQALLKLEAVPAPAGEMPVLLGPGWPGILLHEAIGHGLEGDFNRKKTSAFAELMGEAIAAPGVTVVDDGTIADRRGSLTVDDEGTPSQRTVLIEDGKLVGYMQDRMNARLMGMRPTGNGRRQSYAHAPLPRMTNTYMLDGAHDPGEMIASIDRGIYAVNFGGGQVDITSGKFVFSASEAYLIENGRLGPPVIGATLIGNGPSVLRDVTMVGNDMSLDQGIGTCGKDGQGVPVGVGQPSLLISRLTVGGTSTA